MHRKKTTSTFGACCAECLRIRAAQSISCHDQKKQHTGFLFHQNLVPLSCTTSVRMFSGRCLTALLQVVYALQFVQPKEVWMAIVLLLLVELGFDEIKVLMLFLLVLARFFFDWMMSLSQCRQVFQCFTQLESYVIPCIFSPWAFFSGDFWLLLLPVVLSFLTLNVW